ncbi:MAG: hypothetical protein KBI08_05535 [Sphingobium sp.]|nr:hypothetical protein [Sphingobium sp.]MBP9158125.1 hypothetical protein [Sphingobium sp.]
MSERQRLGFTGIIERVPVRLSPDQRCFVKGTVSAEGIPNFDLGRFVTLYEDAIALYLGTRQLNQACSPRSIRSNLENALRVIVAGQETNLDVLDGISRQLVQVHLAKTSPGPDRLRKAVESAAKHAQIHLSRKGRNPEPERYYLVAAIDRALTDCGAPGSRPTRVGGYFERLISFAFDVAGVGRSRGEGSRYSLVSKAMAQQIVFEEPGIIRYESPGITN